MTETKTKEITKNKINSIIELHEKMRNSHFWRPPSSSNARRNYEFYNSMKAEGKYNGKEISLECKTRCSCKNIYYKGYFYIDGQKCTIVKVKKLVV